MFEVSGSQVPQAPQVSEEEKDLVIDKSMLGLTLIEVGIMQIELFLTGCLSYPESLTLDTWHRWANEYLDKNDLDKAIEWTQKIVKFLEDREKLCEKAQKQSRKHGKRYSRQSSRH